MRFFLPLLLIGVGCKKDEKGPTPYTFPAADAWGTTSGPGGPMASFGANELGEHCAYLTGGPEDVEHHNLVVMHDGYLVLPWAPEDGGGGVTFFRFDDPCNPEKVGEAWADDMRESHSLSFSRVGDREYMAVDYHHEDANGRLTGGIGFWDITDVTKPRWVSHVEIPGYDYPDAYFRVTLSTFWQGPYVYTSSGFLGIHVIDASDPRNPQIVSSLEEWATIPMLMGSFHVVGNWAMASNAGNAQTFLMDLTDPLRPTPYDEGFFLEDGRGKLANYYFANIGGEYGLFARKHEGGGPILYDLTDPQAPAFVSDAFTADGDGGYVFRHEDHLFIGESNFGSIYDMSDPKKLKEVMRVALKGDLDTVTPIGNVAVVAVDSGAADDQSSAVVPWRREPDARGPRLKLHSPRDGEEVPRTARIGLSFDEMIEGRSVFEGSFRVSDKDGQKVEGTWNTQESIVNFTPASRLRGGLHTVEVPAGGISDVSGNPIEETVQFTFQVR